MYKVYFSDGYEITQVQDVQFGHERDIKIHDGLGQGKFPIPDSKGLKTWTIKCQQEDNALFAKLEKLLCSKEETRLVISSNAENISELVLLKSYDKQEVFSGVFNITIKFIEYVKAGIRTTDVPFIARPGKVPVPPKTVIINQTNNTPYKAAARVAKSALVPDILLMTKFEDRFGKPTNPCLLKDGDECRISLNVKDETYNKFNSTVSGKNHDMIENTLKTMNKALAEARRKNNEKLLKAGGESIFDKK